MEGKEAPAPVISAVLEDDDLLGEILLRVAFPTSLVRAALVYTLGCDWHNVECCNGLLIITSGMYHQGAPSTFTRRVRCPLYPARYIAILPPLPDTSIHDGFAYYEYDIVPSVSGDGYFYLALGCKEEQSVLDVYVLQGDIWAIYCSAVTDIYQIELLSTSLIVHDKIYNLANASGIYKLVSLDLASSSLSIVNLPGEVDYTSTDLSLANDSGVHLIHVKGSQLRIWRYMVDKKGLANCYL
uniref:F-box protein AT5G49610-like beta-propeller domain-containing protein n=1 Tax=Aegilops tauschii TaxID=37682 RepID=M8BWD7_AEGTA